MIFGCTDDSNVVRVREVLDIFSRDLYSSHTGVQYSAAQWPNVQSKKAEGTCAPFSDRSSNSYFASWNAVNLNPGSCFAIAHSNPIRQLVSDPAALKQEEKGPLYPVERFAEVELNNR